MYYNPTTQQQKSIYDLCTLFNASIPSTTESYEGWYLVHLKPQPEVTSLQKCVYGPIVHENDKYWQTWNVVDKTPEEIAQETINNHHARIDALEAVVRELMGGND